MKRIVHLSATVAVCLSVAVLLYSQTAQAQQPGRNPATAKNGKKYVATEAIIFENASKTRRLPTDEETQALVDQIGSLTNRSMEGLTVSERPDGTRMMSLEGRFTGVLLGRANEDGTTEVRCVMTFEEAVEFLGLEELTAQQ